MVRPVDTRNTHALRLASNGGLVKVATAVGPAGADGSNVLPTDVAIAAAIDNPASDTAASLSASYDRKTSLVVGSTAADYTTLAAALAVATAGDEIILRAETHALTSVTVPDGVKVRGGQGGAVLAGSFSTTTTAITLGDDASIEGVEIRNTHATGGSGTVPVAITAAAVEGASVRSCKFTGPWVQGVLLNAATAATVADCIFDTIGQTTGTTPGDGINVYGCDGVTIQGCQFIDLKQDGVYVGASSKNVAITGNVFRGSPEGVQVRVSCQSVTIVGNSFDIKGSSTITSFGVIIQTDCVACVVSGNTFRTTAGTATPAAAVHVDTRCHRTVIEGNAIQAGYSKGVAIQTSGGGGTESLGCTIANNVVETPASYAIHVGTAENGATVTGNRVNGGSDKAILIQGSYCAVTGNTVKGNSGFDGITVAGNFNSATGNVVTNVGANAGILISGADCSVTGNTCTLNNTHGINATGARALIVGNSCTGNSHATDDIAASGSNSKIAYNIGRYTQAGAA